MGYAGLTTRGMYSSSIIQSDEPGMAGRPGSVVLRKFTTQAVDPDTFELPEPGTWKSSLVSELLALKQSQPGGDGQHLWVSSDSTVFDAVKLMVRLDIEPMHVSRTRARECIARSVDMHVDRNVLRMHVCAQSMDTPIRLQCFAQLRMCTSIGRARVSRRLSLCMLARLHAGKGKCWRACCV